MTLSPFLLWLLWNLAIAGVIISLVFLMSLIRKRIINKVDKLVAFSVGLIISIVFLGFIPETIEHGWLDPELVWILVLSGILIFYVLELFLHWHHCKDLATDGHSHHDHEHESSSLISVGTFFDNAIHGLVLFSAFSIDIHFGIVTTLAILLHAIPQNIANLLMNHKDTKYVYIAAFGWIFWALMVYPFSEILSKYNFHILAIIAGWLLYTAMSDILPSFKKTGKIKNKIIYLICMILWIFSFSLSSHFTQHEEHSDIHQESTL